MLPRKCDYEVLRPCQTSLTGSLDIRTLVSVTRQGDFVRSGPEVADEVTVATLSEILRGDKLKTDEGNIGLGNLNLTFHLQIEIFKGQENMITMNQTHSKKFHCTYLLHYYPFDTQEHCFLILLRQ